jgi:hypothetical protein
MYVVLVICEENSHLTAGFTETNIGLASLCVDDGIPENIFLTEEAANKVRDDLSKEFPQARYFVLPLKSELVNVAL